MRDDSHSLFARKADESGVQVHGITPANIPGRGNGMVATRDIDKGDTLMLVPIEAIHSLHNVPKAMSSSLPQDMSIHGLLASELALRHEAIKGWSVAAPELAAFESSMPMFWPAELRGLLPEEARVLVSRQLARFEEDWSRFNMAFQDTSRERFLHCWLLVNTRAFYFETPAMLPYPWHDRLALLPLADLFNHGSTGCHLSFSAESYTFAADRQYSMGEEICISYGDHSNDFLLAEYGFIPPDTRMDRLCLDELILPRLSAQHVLDLHEKLGPEIEGLPGRLMLHADSSVDEDVWIALRLMCCTVPDWQSYVDGVEDAEGTLDKATKAVPRVLEDYLGQIHHKLAAIRATEAGEPQHRALLEQRWEQVKATVADIKSTYWFDA